MNKAKPALCMLLALVLIIISCKNNDDPDGGILRPTSIELISGADQQAAAGQELNNPIVVKVLDQNGNPLENAAVTWSVVEGSISDDRTVTGTNGQASIRWTLGPSETQTLSVEISNQPLTSTEVSSTASLPVVTDIDGNQYPVIRFGNQIWTAENLRTTRYGDGTPIPRVDDTDAWSNLAETDKAFSYNAEVFDNDQRYGAMYTWAAATNGQGYSSTNPSGIQGACPVGWHIPSSEEYIQLKAALGGDDAGGAMKETGAENWNSPNAGATNSSGFTGLPGGYRDMSGSYINAGITASFWSTTENCDPCAPANWWLFTNDANFYHGGGTDFTTGLSVRCVMDHE